MREHVGLSLTEAAALHRLDKTAISNTESARFGVSADRVRVWAATYSCSDPAYVDALADEPVTTLANRTPDCRKPSAGSPGVHWP